MPDYVTPIMITQGVVLGCLFLGLIMQVLHYVSIKKTEHRVLVNQAKIIAMIPQPVSLEDMMLQDIQHTLPTELDMDFDLHSTATDEELLAMLEEMNARKEASDVNS